jgi:hypothetical protein
MRVVASRGSAADEVHKDSIGLLFSPCFLMPKVDSMLNYAHAVSLVSVVKIGKLANLESLPVKKT